MASLKNTQKVTIDYGKKCKIWLDSGNWIILAYRYSVKCGQYSGLAAIIG